MSYFEAVVDAPRSPLRLRPDPSPAPPIPAPGDGGNATPGEGRVVTTGVEVPADCDVAFPDLYDAAYRVAHRILLCRERAADVAQEALARAFARWRRVSRLRRPEAWVARVTANLAIDVRRRDRTAREAVLDLRPPSGRETTVAERVDLAAALQLLSKRQREVVTLRYVADLSEADVATELGCSVGAIKQHAARGLARLRGLLGEGAQP